jgi:hypothetical protein
VDREKAGGVNFNEMVNAMGKAFWGNRAPRLKIHPAIEEEPEAAAEDGTAPKKSDYQPAALVRVS